MGRFFDLVNDPVRAAGELSNSSIPAHAPQSSLIKLNANESAYGPSPKAMAAMREALASGHLYPDDASCALRERLAAKHGVQAEQILISNGTTAVLGVIARTLLRPGLNAVTSECSFISYSMVTQAAGAEFVTAPLREGGYDLDAILGRINPSTRIVFLANTNNPTGTLVDAAAVDRFLDRLPGHVILVLDEAYCDYAVYFARKRGVTYSRSLEYLKNDRNVILLRTFSKAHGLAGLRVGYAIAPAELTTYFARAQDVFAVSAMAQAAALAALEDEQHIQYAVENNAQQVEWMERELTSVGLRPLPTWANFLAFDVKQDARDFARRLRREGVLVRPLGAWGAPSFIRVTLGTREQNQFLLQALHKISS
jgi:histidinol-phosphate aminotransferase